MMSCGKIGEQTANRENIYETVTVFLFKLPVSTRFVRIYTYCMYCIRYYHFSYCHNILSFFCFFTCRLINIIPAASARSLLLL